MVSLATLCCLGCKQHSMQRSANISTQIFTSGVSTITIWWYYWFSGIDPALSVLFWEFCLLLIAIFSTVMFFLVVGAAVAEDADLISQTFHDRLLTIEMLAADIPKIVIVTIIEAYRPSGFAGLGTMAILAAIYNAVLDFLTMMRNGEEDDGEIREDRRQEDSTVDDDSTDIEAARRKKRKKKKSKKKAKKRDDSYDSDSDSDEDVESAAESGDERVRREQEGKRKKKKSKKKKKRSKSMNSLEEKLNAYHNENKGRKTGGMFDSDSEYSVSS